MAPFTATFPLPLALLLPLLLPFPLLLHFLLTFLVPILGFLKLNFLDLFVIPIIPGVVGKTRSEDFAPINRVLLLDRAKNFVAVC